MAPVFMKPGICQTSVLHHMKPQWMTRAENWESFRLVKDSPQKNRGREVRPNFSWPIGKLCHSVFVQFRVQWFRSSLMGVRIEDLLHNHGKMVFRLFLFFQSLRIQLWIMIMIDYEWLWSLVPPWLSFTIYCRFFYAGPHPLLGTVA